MNCPKCGSKDLSGLVQAFWACVKEDGSPVRDLRELVDSETEIGMERLCNDCGHEFEAGD